jgi:hypothetical protein
MPIANLCSTLNKQLQKIDTLTTTLTAAACFNAHARLDQTTVAKAFVLKNPPSGYSPKHP